MELATLQQTFYDALFDKEGPSVDQLYHHIQAAQELTPAQGLAIYRDSVTGKLSRTLKAIYPVCYRLVGEKFFEATATTFIYRHPSFSPDLGDYGEQFADFLAHFKPAAALPYLPDVARLEWHWHRVFNGEDTTTLDLEMLSKIPPTKWDGIIFHLPKNSVLLESVYPIHHIWQVNQPDYQGDEQVNLEEGGVKIFLWRYGYDMRIDLPTDQEWQLLKAFQTDSQFAKICEDLVTSGLEIPVLLPQLVQQGWIASFSMANQ